MGVELLWSGLIDALPGLSNQSASKMANALAKGLLLTVASLSVTTARAQDCVLSKDTFDRMDRKHIRETQAILVHDYEDYSGTAWDFISGGVFGGLGGIKRRPEVNFFIAVGDRSGVHYLKFETRHKNINEWRIKGLRFLLQNDSVFNLDLDFAASTKQGDWDYHWSYLKVPDEVWNLLATSPLSVIRIYHDHNLYKDLQILPERSHTIIEGVQCIAVKLGQAPVKAVSVKTDSQLPPTVQPEPVVPAEQPGVPKSERAAATEPESEGKSETSSKGTEVPQVVDVPSANEPTHVTKAASVQTAPEPRTTEPKPQPAREEPADGEGRGGSVDSLPNGQTGASNEPTRVEGGVTTGNGAVDAEAKGSLQEEEPPVEPNAPDSRRGQAPVQNARSNSNVSSSSTQQSLGQGKTWSGRNPRLSVYGTVASFTGGMYRYTDLGYGGGAGLEVPVLREIHWFVGGGYLATHGKPVVTGSDTTERHPGFIQSFGASTGLRIYPNGRGTAFYVAPSMGYWGFEQKRNSDKSKEWSSHASAALEVGCLIGRLLDLSVGYRLVVDQRFRSEKSLSSDLPDQAPEDGILFGKLGLVFGGRDRGRLGSAEHARMLLVRDSLLLEARSKDATIERLSQEVREQVSTINSNAELVGVLRDSLRTGKSSKDVTQSRSPVQLDRCRNVVEAASRFGANVTAVNTVLHAFSDPVALDTFRVLTIQLPSGGVKNQLEIVSSTGRLLRKEEILSEPDPPSRNTEVLAARVERDQLRAQALLGPWSFRTPPVTTNLLLQFERREQKGYLFDVGETTWNAILGDDTAVGFVYHEADGSERVLVYSKAERRTVDIAPMSQ